MARKFYDALSLATVGSKVGRSFKPPTDEDFKDYILRKWPSFDWFDAAPKDPFIKWGCVSKDMGTPNQISILSNIVVAAESPVGFTLGRLRNQDLRSL
jgi:hypothetical protein